MNDEYVIKIEPKHMKNVNIFVKENIISVWNGDNHKKYQINQDMKHIRIMFTDISAKINQVLFQHFLLSSIKCPKITLYNINAQRVKSKTTPRTDLNYESCSINNFEDNGMVINQLLLTNCEINTLNLTSTLKANNTNIETLNSKNILAINLRGCNIGDLNILRGELSTLSLHFSDIKKLKGRFIKTLWLNHSLIFSKNTIFVKEVTSGSFKPIIQVGNTTSPIEYVIEQLATHLIAMAI